MCSIVMGFDPKLVMELVEQNRYRGEINHSVTELDQDKNVVSLIRQHGPLVDIDDKITDGNYIIIHQQAPTDVTQKEENVQPAWVADSNMSSLLWHNGILKDQTIKGLASVYPEEVLWDTKLMLKYLVGSNDQKRYTKVLSELNGSFACVLHVWERTKGNSLYVFRNELAPMFVDENLTFSSTEFDESLPLRPNTIFSVDFVNRVLVEVATFKTYDLPWDLPENVVPIKKPSEPKTHPHIDFGTMAENIEIVPDYDPNIRYGEWIAERYQSYFDLPEIFPETTNHVAREARWDDYEGNPCKDPNYVSPFEKNYKFNEQKYLQELESYINNTYKEHYSKGDVQTFELIVSSGQCDGFTMGSVMKYSSRYGKKNGFNRKDLLKIAHYALLQLYAHDRENRG